MKFLLESFFSSQWFLIIILVVAVALLMLSSFSRKKKEENYRNELNEKIVKGAKVKTYSGLYCTVVNVTNTTDGKIVLVSTGEGDKISYQLIHINAIFGVDEKEEVFVGTDGNEYTAKELKEKEEQEKAQAKAEEKPATTPAVEEVKAEAEPKAEEKPAKTTTKKTKKQN